MNEKIKTDYSFENGVLISNSIYTLENKNFIKLQCRYCIAIGRLLALKQLDKLIEPYSESNLSNASIHFVILGDGIEKVHLQNKIKELKISSFIVFDEEDYVREFDEFLQYKSS